MKQIVLGALVAVSLTACGGSADQEYAEAAPSDFDALALEVSGASNESALTSSEGVARQGLQGDEVEFLGLARARVHALNEQVKRVVVPVAALIAADLGKAPVGDVKVYGPHDKDGITYRLAIDGERLGRFGWVLEAKKAGSADEFKAFATGLLTRGLRPHRGTGVFGIDIDVLKAIDPSIKAAGKVLAGFGHVGDTKTLAYALKDFTADAANEQTVSGVFVGHRLMPSRATSIRVHARVNLKDSPTDAKELVRARVRYIPGVGGRADVLATEGDVPAGKVYFGSACWDAQEQEGFAILRLCDRGQPLSCQVIATRGERSNCRLSLENELTPPEDPMDPSLEPDAPATDVTTPVVMPSGTGD